MRLVNWLKGRAASDEAEAPPLPQAQKSVPAPAQSDIDTIEFEEPNEQGEILLEEIYTIIDYVDARGFETRRRVTLLKVGAGKNGPLLSAICHERKALRHFRCDRIQDFIDLDGVVTPTQNFFRDFLQVDLSVFETVQDAQDSRVRPTVDVVRSSLPDHPEEPIEVGRRLRELLRSPLSVLVTAAKSDTEFHVEEHDVICRYAEREAEEMRKRGYVRDVRIVDLDVLNKLIRHMRPRQSSAENHLSEILDMEEHRFKRFKRALGDVIIADGRIASGEADFVELLSELDTLRQDRLGN